MDNITDIDTRIVLLTQEIVHLRRRRNELVPIRRLPNEIVTQIFRLLASSSIPQPKSRITSAGSVDYLSSIFKLCQPSEEVRWDTSVGWVHLMSSCTWLRAIALDDHELWRLEGNIIRIPSGIEWRELCVQRARFLGQLTLHCQLDPSKGISHVEQSTYILREKLPQVREAYILFLPAGVNDTGESESISSFDVDLYTEAVWYGLGQACPQLQYLNIFWDQLTICNDLLDNGCTSLATLVLTNVKDLETWPDLPCLRHLMVVFCDLAEVPMVDLLEWLGSIDTLETLSLEGSGSTRGFSNSHLTSPMNLPNLRIVRLRMCAAATARVLHALPDPTTGLDIDMLNYDLDTITAAPLQVYYEILQRIIAFWAKADSLLEPSHPLDVTLNCPIEMDSIRLPVVGQLIMRSSSFSASNYMNITRRFCHFNGRYGNKITLPPGIKITTLNLLDACKGKERVSPLHYYDSLLGQAVIDTVVWDLVEHFRQDQVGQLETWLMRRKEQSKAIRLLKIRESKIRKDSQWLQTIADTVRKSQVVDDVQWMACCNT